MRKLFILLFVGLVLMACDPKVIDAAVEEILGDATGVSNTEIAAGLKEALNKGVLSGTSLLSKTDGYYKSPYKILLPQEAQKVADKLRVIPGFSNVEKELEIKINRAAEDAAKKAKPIFAEAIRSMTFSDVMDILKGENNAATMYLERKTSQKLYSEFNPVIVNSLNKYGALDYWEDAVNAYNKIPLVDQMNPKLDDYITNRALDGLFKMIEKEEGAIRTNVGKRTTELLRKVFALQD
jgi:hypothetical protein